MDHQEAGKALKNFLHHLEENIGLRVECHSKLVSMSASGAVRLFCREKFEAGGEVSDSE